jgi:hypothetical protein
MLCILTFSTKHINLFSILYICMQWEIMRILDSNLMRMRVVVDSDSAVEDYVGDVMLHFD